VERPFLTHIDHLKEIHMSIHAIRAGAAGLVLLVVAAACSSSNNAGGRPAPHASAQALSGWSVPAGADPERPWEAPAPSPPTTSGDAAPATTTTTMAEPPRCLRSSSVPAPALFEADSTELLPGAKDALDAAVRDLCVDQSQPLLVVGHTSSDGTDNETLSTRRAAAAGDYLRSLGFATVTTLGVGATQPIADNGTPEGRALNRRVVVSVAEG
jgi:outer membrane protein OmpA-like peptidoglycan-associated protein